MTWIFDWQSVEDRLFDQSLETTQRFAVEHPDVVCACFAYDTDPIYGYCLPSFDTCENSLQRARTHEHSVLEMRKKLLTQQQAWRSAKSASILPSLADFNEEIGFFTYHIYANITFPELDEMWRQDTYPKGEEYEDNYIEGNVRIILWKVVERLIASQVFEQMKLASPFRIGYAFHDEPFVTLRILNWPQV